MAIGSSHPRRRGTVRSVLGGALDLAFPATCIGCGKEGDAVCRACCPGLDVRRDVPPGIPIGLPGEIPPGLLQLEWAAPFTGLVREALHLLKYSGETRLAVPLGQAAASRWAVAGRGADLVVPVPVHRERERERGYDQAALIAAVVGEALALPVARALARSRATRAQFSLGRAARRGNVAGAFVLAGAGAPRLVAGRRILLVDDVVTTGATLAACAAVLLDAGATGVAALTVARER